MAASQQPWKPEWEVDSELAAKLISSQFPQLTPVEIEVLGAGWDNLALLVNQEFVFRFPRRRLGAKVMESEVAVLPHLAAHIETPIPQLRFVGEATKDFPCSFAGYPRLLGETACSVSLNDAQRSRGALPLARFLRALHSHDEQQALGWGAPFDDLGRTEIPRRAIQGRENLARLASTDLLHAFSCEVFADYLRDIEANPPTLADGLNRPRVLVHGDLYVRHLLVDQEGDLTGVIDWGDVHCGDAAIDLAVAFCYFSRDAVQAFFAAYGAIDIATRRMAMMRAIQHTAVVTVYANEVSDKRLLFAALDSLARLESHLLEGDWGCSAN